MLTSSEMARVDQNAGALGVSRKQLMESSGNAVARIVQSVANQGDQVVVVAGRGNNGGDGFVAARYLDDFEVTILLLGRPETIGSQIAKENWDALQRADYDTRIVTDSSSVTLPSAAVVIDAILGTGVTGSLREPSATAVRAINDGTATVISVDVPTGLNAETGELPPLHVEPNRVVSFHDEKPGLDELDAPVTIADIGIPKAAELYVGPGDLDGKPRAPETHKGDHGTVLIVGGGPYTGAPSLAGQAALRGGADLVRVACPASVAEGVQGFEESLIVRELSGDCLGTVDVEPVLEMAIEHDVVVLGPGLGDADTTREAVTSILTEYEGVIIVDADALSVFPDCETNATVICTPHPGELESMGGPEIDRKDELTRVGQNMSGSRESQLRDGYSESIRRFAADLGQVLLVKGHHDVITDGERFRVNRSGTPAMTVGGTGDVLAGVVGAVACRLDPFRAAAVAAYGTGRAGETARTEIGGEGLLPTDILPHLPTALSGKNDD